MEQKVLHTFTGYQPPHWSVVLWDFIKSLFADHALVKASAAPYPASHITDITAIPVAMQGLWGNCVEETVTFAKKYYDYKKTGVVPNLSPFELFMISNPSENGTSLKTALERARTNGISEVQYFPDPNTNVAYNGTPVIPSPVALANGLTHTISGYMLTTDVSSLDLKSLINQFGIILVGLKLDNAWWTPSWMNLTMPLVPPADNSPTLSYHCVALYGYDANGNFYGRNWWSNQWNPSMGGNFTINGSYLNSIYEVAVVQ